MLNLDRTAPGRYTPEQLHAPGAGNLAFGGHLLALLVMAATDALDDRRLTSLHTLFGRGVRIDEEVSFEAEVIAAGRNAASTHVRVRQGGTSCVDALALALTAQDMAPRHGAVPPDVGSPGDASPAQSLAMSGALEVRIIEGTDRSADGASGTPTQSLWVRPTRPLATVAEAQAMMAYASEPHFLGTALLAHDGWSAAQSYSRFIPAVLSHTMHFHLAPPLDGGWWLYVVDSPHLADGRVFGRGDVFTEDGTLLASTSQENLMRPLTPKP